MSRVHLVAFRRAPDGRLQCCEGRGASLLEARVDLERALQLALWVTP